jgi:glutathione peroxidase
VSLKTGLLACFLIGLSRKIFRITNKCLSIGAITVKTKQRSSQALKDNRMSQSVYDIPVKTIQGNDTTLNQYQGKVLLIVNTASKCGLTPQYEGLEKLYKEKKDQGLEILGFPANNFLAQEPGSDEEIQEFCSLNYQVNFPLFSKISVAGEDKHPLYQTLTQAIPERMGEGPWWKDLVDYGLTPNPKPEVLWNFEKFLINKNGEVVARFAPDITADDARIVDAVNAELAK